jgi:hypothetical protein
LWDFYINNYPETIDLVELRIKYYELPIRELLDQNNKAWLKRVEGLRLTVDEINSRWEDPEYVWENYDKLVEFTKGIIKDFNTSIDNLVNKFKEGKE